MSSNLVSLNASTDLPNRLSTQIVCEMAYLELVE